MLHICFLKLSGPHGFGLGIGIVSSLRCNLQWTLMDAETNSLARDKQTKQPPPFQSKQTWGLFL